MSDWIRRYAAGWHGEWLGPCPSTTFAYEFPIPFDWAAQCADGAAGSFEGYGDGGVMTLVPELRAGFTVKHSWSTDIIKTRSGAEQRTPRNSIARESYTGEAGLLGDQPVAMRTAMAKYAAIGARFLLGMPHEALALVADSDGSTVFVPTTGKSDWVQVGQRVVVAHIDDDGLLLAYVNAVIQDYDADEIDLDIEPGDLGLVGGEIMPARAIYLTPQQDFPRFPVDVETWNLDAIGATPLDYAPVLASIPLAALSAPFADVVATVRTFSLTTKVLDLVGSAGYPNAGQLIETGPITTFRYKPGVTTLGDFDAALAGSDNFKLTGDWDPTDTFTGTEDIFIEASGAGANGEVGRGATLTEYDDLPVWDEPISVPKGQTVTDGVHALTSIIDHGGIPYALGTADKADWFRQVSIVNGDTDVWQWFKLFMHTAKGRQGEFWLPTWRADLEYVEHTGDEITIDADDIGTWWPALRDRVQIEQEDGTITYAQITARAGDVITISETLSASDVTSISWLERCCFESADDYTTVHGLSGFSVSLVARAVECEPLDPVVELVTIEHGTTTHRLTTGTTDIVHDSQIYTATAAARGVIGVAQSGNGKEMTLTLPIDHAFVRRYLQLVTPPRRITVTLRRLYLPSEDSEIAWIGYVTELAVDGDNTQASFTVPSRMSEYLLRSLPARTVGKRCPFVLYDDTCKVSRTASVGGIAHKVTTTVIAVDGRDVRVDLANVARNGTWAELGELLHTASGERGSVRRQADLSPGTSAVTVLSLDLPIPGMKVGDSVDVFAGCNWGLEHCSAKFENKDNYGGQPVLPSRNPHAVAGVGVED